MKDFRLSLAVGLAGLAFVDSAWAGERPRFHPPYIHAAQPGYPAGGLPYGVPHRARLPYSEDALERHIERVIKGQFGRAVDDIDVDVDNRRGRIEIEAEVRHPAIRRQLEQLLYSMPELAGYQLRFDIDVDD